MKTKLLCINIFNFLIYFILFALLQFSNNYIVFPIKMKNKLSHLNDDINSAEDYISFIKNDLVSTNIYFGSPPKIIEIYLTLERLDFILGEGFCLINSESNYNSSLSTSFKKSNTRFTSQTFINGFLSYEDIILYNDFNLSQNITLQEFNFIIGNPSPDIFDIKNNNSFCGYMGLQISSSSDYFEWNSIIYQLKSGRLINSEKWTIYFNQYKINNYDGVLIIGIKGEEYKNILNFLDNTNDEYRSIYSSNTISSSDYGIKFDEIYYNFNNQNFTYKKFIESIFFIDYDYIISNEDYFNSIKNSFFSKYIENDIWFIDKAEKFKKNKKNDLQILNIIFCEKNKFGINDLQNFPKLNFKHVGLNQIFELNYEDLFQETKKYFIFKIFLNENNKRVWHLGRIFLKKYLFVFDNDQKTITYIGINNLNKKGNKNDIKNDNNFSNNKFYLILLLSILIIGIAVVVGLFLGKIIFNKNKKKRANELDDDYEYIEKKNNKNESIGIGFDDND